MRDTSLCLYLAGLQEDSIVDGPGMRLAVFTQGCPHHCPGCHNPETWPTGGVAWRVEELLDKIRHNALCGGLTLSGGEPLAQAASCAQLAQGAKEAGRNVWLYSGYTWEDIQRMMDEEEAVKRLMQHVDVLVDGPFMLAERDLTLLFRGSRNQRLVDVPGSLQSGALRLWESTYGNADTSLK